MCVTDFSLRIYIYIYIYGYGRAVAKYLQIMFDKEGERGRNLLGVNNLLAGKTRREASRMFFETLVCITYCIII